MNDKKIYRFGQGISDWPKEQGDPTKILGGKGAGLQAMSTLGLPVPPGFTIPTTVCNEYRASDAPGQDKLLTELLDEIMKTHIQWLKTQFGYLPLLSVRSGAPVSMPGMMDTILNVGLTDSKIQKVEPTMPAWQDRIGAKPALDSMRRLIQMLGSTAFGIDHDKFEFQLKSIKKQENVETDQQLSKKALETLVGRYKQVFSENTGTAFPQDVRQQLGFAIRAVFDSWMSERAVEYRKINKIDEDMGTACTVQAMVFGNMGEDSGTGVLFTRHPMTGENDVMGEYLVNAQGEDVVAGIRTPEPITQYFKDFSDDASGHGTYPPKYPWVGDLAEICSRLEDAYKDMVDIEFTVQQGKLFILQSRRGKRSAPAAFKIAYDLVEEGVIDQEEALSRLTVDQFRAVRRPAVSPEWNEPPDLVGLPVSPGVAMGRICTSAEAAINCTEKSILVAHETVPDDIAGMAKAEGILTMTGGATSHAAVVARGMDKPCVVGCTDLEIQGDLIGKTGSWCTSEHITIDGGTGRVWFRNDVPVIDNSNSVEVKAIMQWCLDKMGWVEASLLDKPEDAGPHRIIAAQWWGDDAVLEAVLDSLAERESRKGVVIDLTPPHQLHHSEDQLLVEAFSLSEQSEIQWALKIGDKLATYGKKLAGLTMLHLILAPETETLLKKNGIVIPTPPTTVRDLMQESVGPPSEEFINEIIGGHEAYQSLRRLLIDAGYSMSVVPEAVPPEYAAFTVLRQ